MSGRPAPGSTALLVATAAALSAAVTAAAVLHLAGRRRAAEGEEYARRRSSSGSGGGGGAPTAAGQEEEEQEGCRTPEPTLAAPGHKRAAPPPRRQQQRQQQQQQQQLAGADALSLFSPVDARARPDPYDVRARTNHLSWDDYFMAVAFLSAQRSKDPNKQVGAVIVDGAHVILGIGYNGFPRGCADAALPWAKRAASGSVLDTKYPYVVHAEANALLNKNQAAVGGARIYVTLFPCNECAKLLIQAGIREVIFHEAKLEPTGKRPGTMEQAAAADEAEDGEAGQNWRPRRAGCGDACAPADQTPAEPERRGRGGPHAAPPQPHQHQHPQRGGGHHHHHYKQQRHAPGVGAPSPPGLDASYVASQRLLTMAGVKLRQHTLQRSILLGPHGGTSIGE